MMKETQKPRLIAFYLPQYHPIPENDKWWGKGFTEWTNVAKAKPLFKGHYQPHIPADLGFYDLRKPEVRQAQADMAREFGISGFCYYHYWFAGKQLLEKPFYEVLQSGKPNFPFCLCWANETWTGVWHGAPNRILIEQTYPGEVDNRNHFNSLLPAFQDPRYIRVENKPLFVIYQPQQIPNLRENIQLWQTMAKDAGLDGIYFLGFNKPDWDYEKYCFNGLIIDEFSIILHKMHKGFKGLPRRIFNKFIHKKVNLPRIFEYKDYVSAGLSQLYPGKDRFPVVLPNWDNTPRSKYGGTVLRNSNPELFRVHLQDALIKIKIYKTEKQFIFIKSWNEWAEGNYLEPDQKFGHEYLNVIKDANI